MVKSPHGKCRVHTHCNGHRRHLWEDAPIHASLRPQIPPRKCSGNGVVIVMRSINNVFNPHNSDESKDTETSAGSNSSSRDSACKHLALLGGHLIPDLAAVEAKLWPENAKSSFPRVSPLNASWIVFRSEKFSERPLRQERLERSRLG